MNSVYIEYNPFEPKLRVSVNGHSVSKYSSILALENRPFTEWCSKLFKEIEKEVNGEYELRYCCDDTSAMIIEAEAQADRCCQKANRELPTIDFSLEERLEILSSLGADEGKSATIHILGEEDIQCAAFGILSESGLFDDCEEEIIYSSLPCFKIAFRPTERFDSELVKENSAFVYITVSDNMEELYHKAKYFDKPVFVLHIGGETRFSHIDNNFIVFDVDADDIPDILLGIAVDLPISLMIGEEQRKLVSSYQKGTLLITENEVQNLYLSARTKPCYKVDISDTTYLGRKCVLTVEECPFIEYGEYSLVSSNPDVISTEGMRISVNSMGNAKLVLNKGGDTDLWEKKITVKEATLINALAIFPEVKHMRVGEEEKIKVEYYPKEAINSFEIKWKIEDESIATVDKNGTVKILQAGNTVLTVYTPDTSDRMFIKASN